MQSQSAVFLGCRRHQYVHTASSGTETPVEQPVPGAADFLSIAGRQILIIRAIDAVTALGQDLGHGCFHPIGRRVQRDIDHVRFMRDGRASASRCPDDGEGEAEDTKGASHLVLLSFNR